MEERPFLDLHERVSTPIAQTLVLGGAHAFKYETLIRPALASGSVVISDRYTGSLVAYQSTLLERGGEDPSLALRIARMLPEPDMSIFLPVDRDVQRKRLEHRGTPLNSRELDFLSTVQERLQAGMGPSAVTYRQEGGIEENIHKLYRIVSDTLWKNTSQ